MTLQENIATMTAIANAAGTTYQTALNKLVEVIQSNRTELITLGQTLSSKNTVGKGYVNTFDNNYINLFMDSFRDVDRLMTKLTSEGPLTEEEFQSAALAQLGIEMYQKSGVCKYLYNKEGPIDIKPGELFKYTTITNSSNASFGPKYVRWVFPFKFYYSPDKGGVSHGDLYLHTPKSSLSIGDNYWHEDIQAYGPYKLSNESTETYRTYKQLLEDLALTYGTCQYDQTPTGDMVWATWPADQTPLNGKGYLFTTSATGYIPFEELSATAQTRINDAALILRTDDNQEYYVNMSASGGDSRSMMAIQPKPKNVHPWGLKYDNDKNPDGHEAPFFIGTITIVRSGVSIFTGGMGTACYECQGKYSDLNLIWKEPLPAVIDNCWHPEKGIKQIFVRYSSDRSMLYNFDKFLVGNFGPHATTEGMDALLERFQKTQKDKCLAEYWRDWFNSEAREFGNAAAIKAALSTERSVEQAASLYAVKFALMKMMFGHARRLQIG